MAERSDEVDDEQVRADAIAAFLKFDKDASGDIDVSELHSALKEAGLSVDDEQSAYLLRKYDDDRGQSLDLDEFTCLVKDLRRENVAQIKERLELRTHPDVEAQLTSWWMVVVHALCDHTWPSTEAAGRRGAMPPSPGRKKRRHSVAPPESKVLHHEECVRAARSGKRRTCCDLSR